MSLISAHLIRPLGRAAALLAATTIPLALAVPAGAVNPPGSVYEIFVENATNPAPGDPANAVQDGWWGKEGVAKDAGTLFSANIKADNGTAFVTAFGGDWNKIGIAYVPTSADGSAERPTVTAGELAGQAFQWYSDAPAFGSVQYNASSNPGVDGLWTQAGKDQWVADGKPSTAFDSNLVQHTPLVAGDPVAPHQYQTSLLNTWPAGTKVSLVYFEFDSFNSNGEPVLHVGTDGKAVTAWMPFVTVADPSDASLLTSGGYHVAGAKVTPTVTLAEKWSGSTGTLTATISTPAGTATDATGTVQFEKISNGTASPAGSPVTVSAGAASMSLAGVPVDTVFDAVYTPDTAAAATYDGATSGRKTILGPPATATATSLAVTGTLKAGQIQKLTASVSPSSAVGTVTFKDGAKSLGAVKVVSGKAAESVKLAVGRHVLTAVFSPSSSSFKASASAAKAVTIAKTTASLATTLAPKTVKAGTRPTLTITVRASGLTVTGRVQVTVTPPRGKATTLAATLKGGVTKVILPTILKGTTKLTVKYLGSTSVLAASKSLMVRVG